MAGLLSDIGGLMDPSVMSLVNGLRPPQGPQAMPPSGATGPAANPFSPNHMIPFMAGVGFGAFTDHVRKLSNLANPNKNAMQPHKPGQPGAPGASAAPGAPGTPPAAPVTPPGTPGNPVLQNRGNALALLGKIIPSIAA